MLMRAFSKVDDDGRIAIGRHLWRQLCLTSDGYVSTLRQSRLGKGFLVVAGPHRYSVSNAGREVVGSKIAKTKQKE